MPLSRKEDEVLISEQSVIITTLPQGPPKSKPLIVRAVAVDHTTISVSWEPGPFPNGPILSYSLRIKDLSLTGEDGVFKVFINIHLPITYLSSFFSFCYLFYFLPKNFFYSSIASIQNDLLMTCDFIVG